jgi:iron complex outermembrane receptor protein
MPPTNASAVRRLHKIKFFTCAACSGWLSDPARLGGPKRGADVVVFLRARPAQDWRNAVSFRRLLLAGAGCALAIAMAPGVHAQTVNGGATASPPAPGAGRPATASVAANQDTAAPVRRARGNRSVEDVVVTAQRRVENQQRVPVSITALTAATIARANITTTAAIQQVTPGLTWTSANRSALPYIRGIGSPDISVGSESSVALYVDGIYIESSPASMLALNNIERIEVLKGPQGTLFGRNATGGLVQIITKQPSQTPHGSLDIGYANFNTLTANGYLTGPLTEHISADIAFILNDQNNGWGRNVNLDRQIDIDRTMGFRSKILFDYGDTRFTLGGDYTHERTDIGSERNIVPGFTGRPIDGVPTQTLPGFYDSQSNIYPLGILTTGGVNLHAEHDFNFAKLLSISSYRDTHFTSMLDVDETPLKITQLTFDTHVKAFTQELQLASRGSDRLRWITGVFYMHRNGTDEPFAVAGSAVGFPPFFGYENVDDGIKSDVVAPYGQATYRLWAGTEITGGVRYTIEHQVFTGHSTGATGLPGLSVDADATYKVPTYRAAINHTFGKQLMVYASYNRGFKSGVFNATSLADPPARPETVNAYETGFKSDLFDRSVRLNGAAFQYDYQNIQLSVPSGPSAKTINAAKAKIRGLEGTVETVPVEDLTLTVGVSYIPYAKYLSFPDAPAYPSVPTGGNSQITFDDAGGRMIRVPKFTASASADYSFRVPRGAVDMAANLYYSSAYYWNVDRLVKEERYQVLNAQLNYKMDNGVRFGAWVSNLLDEKYYSGASETSNASVYSPAPPRTYGLRVGYAF